MGMGLSKLRELVMDREAWRAVIHQVAKSQTQLSDWTELMLLNANTKANLEPGASLVAQLVKNLPAIEETQVQFLGQEDLLEKG